MKIANTLFLVSLLTFSAFAQPPGGRWRTGGGSSWQQTTSNYPTGVLTIRRPAIGANFGQSIRPETAKLVIDGQDFTGSSQIQGDRIFWNPTYDLDTSNHQATATAFTYQGRRLTQSWNFQIQATNGDTSGNVPFLSMKKQFPAPGQGVLSRPSIGADFNGQLDRIVLKVDGQDFTRQARTTPNHIAWTPTYDLDGGAHTVHIHAVGVRGRVVDNEWTFYVNQAQAPSRVQMSGQWPDGNQVTGPRPAVGARFDQPLARLRLFVDGIEFTNLASRSDTSISWTPGYNLVSGLHTARVAATGRDGQPVNSQWQFRVAPQAASIGYPHYGAEFDLGSVQQVTPFPGPNSTSSDGRPAIGVQLPSSLQFRQPLLIVDGRDFTAFLRKDSDTCYWQPDYNLQRGWHHATFRATAGNGERLEQNWQFQVP